MENELDMFMGKVKANDFANFSHDIPIFNMFPKLKATLPRIQLTNLPTPVHKLNYCSETLNSSIWIKRDDLSNTLYGGNKPRKYEFIFADLLKKRKNSIFSIGGIGSNHAVAATIFSKELGLKSHVFLLNQPLTEHVRGNLLLDHLFGAEFHYSKTIIGLAFKVLWNLNLHPKAYFAFPGASSSLGIIGYVNAGIELGIQVTEGILPKPDKLFVAVGSSGTCAGLILGLELAGLDTKVIGIGVAMKRFTSKNRVLRLAKNTLKHLREHDSSVPRISKTILSDKLIVTHDYFGTKYGKVTYECLEAINMIKRDNIDLETCYTAKTYSGLIDYCQKNKNALNENLLFWNTFNSSDILNYIKETDYKELPVTLHKFFNGTVPLDDSPIHCERYSREVLRV